MSEWAWEERLSDALTKAGRPALLLVAGAAGMGKSRLAHRLAESLQGQAVARLIVSFRASGALLVSEPHTQRSRDRDQTVPGERRQACPTADATPDAGEKGGSGSGTAAGRALAVALTSVQPVLLIIEDVHHADESCLEVLRDLLREPAERFAAVLTYRPEHLASRGLPLGRAVDYPARLSVTQWGLKPLDEEHVRGVAEEWLGAENCSAELVTRLRQRSAGVPQVLVDLLCMLRDAGNGRKHFTLREVDEVGVPARLAESVLAKVEALPESHRPIVWAAAVLGRPASARDLAAVAELSEGSGRKALIAALDLSALRETEENRYGFAVPLEASAVYGHLPGPIREHLHHRAAVILITRKPVPWAHVARHWQKCGRMEEWLRATERLSAGDSGGTITEDELAVGLLEQALDEGGGSPQRRARLALALARGATLGLRTEETVQALRRVVADTSLPPAARGEIRLELGLLLHNQKRRFHEGREQVRRAVGELHERPTLATVALVALANPFFPGSSLSENHFWLRRAEETAVASQSGTAHTAAVASRATLLMIAGDPQAWQLLERLPRNSSAPLDRQQVARALCNTASGAIHLGHHRRGNELLSEGMELAARSDAPFLAQVGYGTALYRAWLTGSWEGLAERCTRTVSEDGTANEARTVLALLALARGEWTAAHAWLPRGAPPSFDGCEVPVATTAAGAYIRLLLAREEGESAASAAASAWSWLRRKGVWAWGAELAPWAVEAHTRADRRETARKLVAEFADGLAGRDAPTATAALLWCRAVLAEAEGEQEEASAHFQESSAAYARLSYPYAQALTSEGAGRCAFLTGSRADAAAEMLAGAVERFDQLGASWDAARTRAVLRAHRPASGRPRGRPAYTERLSPRESEVAELAGSGLTNRQIATTLYLSPRTVEHHVSRAMRKLGVRFRQELAERALRGRSPRDAREPADD
ncbi:helix-turn-helix transcriptional regulator [Streptomyces sp. IB2014 016-6]|uniref:helix-turn-helix transcriptional regulator n=1 Tax=Streptomyces sp. IB2014 016-6 TaxID=2517818 RepID=UPI00164FA9B7|nr:helix-turn-helix transcriptional regulator [Streptomyces sp. IB2014 016-6]